MRRVARSHVAVTCSRTRCEGAPLAEDTRRTTDASTARTLALGEAPGVPEDGRPDLRAPYVAARFAAQNDFYVGLYQAWTKTGLFLMGKQWLRWMDGQRAYVADTDVPPWRQQPVTNLVYAIYRSLDAKMSKQRPTLEVVPPTGDSEDREAASLGEAVLQHLWRLLKMPQKIRRARGWYFIAGVTYLRVWWNPDAGKMRPLTTLVEVPDPNAPPEFDEMGMLLPPPTIDLEVAADENGEPYLLEDGTPDLEREPAMVPEGDIGFDYESPMAIRFNPDALDADDATEMYVAKLMPKTEVAKTFDIPVDSIETGDKADRQFYHDLMQSAASGTGWSAASSVTNSTIGADLSEATGDMALVIEYYCKPEPGTYPEGRHWISVGQTKVWPKAGDAEYPTGEAPLPDGFWPPYIPVVALPIPGQPHGLGALTQVVPLNEQLNTLDGKIAEHEVTMAMGGKWVVAQDDKDLFIDSDPAQVLISKGYTQGRPPQQTRPVALPMEIYAERDVIMSKVRTVLSMSDADFGQRPEGVSAGRAFLVLQEVTDSVLGPDLDAWASAYEEVGRRMLILVQKYYREERTIAIRGDKGQWEVRSFKGADLTDGLDVRVQSGSMFPWSKSAQWDTKLNVLSTFPQLVTDPETGAVDAQKFAQYLDAGGSGLAAFESDDDPDLVEVQREHAMFEAYDPSRGQVELPELGFWQAHAKHLEAHYRFLKMSRGRFNRWTPEAQQAFLEHCQKTAAAVDALAQQMFDAQNAAAPAEMVAQEESGAGLPPDLAAQEQMVAPGQARDRSLTSPQLQPADFAAGE